MPGVLEKPGFKTGASIFLLKWLYWLPVVTGFESVLPANYTKEFPPAPSSSPTGRLEVQISLMFMNILGVNEVQEELQFSCFFRVYWSDARLPDIITDIPIVVLSGEERKQLWRPDIVTENVRGIERNGIIKPTIFNGRFPGKNVKNILYSSYTAIRVGCPYHYQLYPMDVQTCTIHIGTMGLTTAEVHLTWHDETGFKMDRLQFLKYQDLFRVKLCENVHQSTRTSAFGEHPQKTLILIFERNFKSSILQLYLPSVIFIMIAWLSVLVPPTMLRTRLLLNSTNLLTIISMFLSISKTESSRVPKVSYITALNLWMFVCVAFCFSSVLLVILDIRLVVILSIPGRRLRFVRDLFRPKNTDPPSVTASSNSLSVSESSEDADEDGDVFVDASDVTPSNSIDGISESELRAQVASKRVEWLTKTAGFEQVYMYGYPLLFVLFVLAYFTYFLWKRNWDMHRVIDDTGGPGAKYPGCWCLPDDTDEKCMRPLDYTRM